jgi:hypothetical protein
VTIDPEIGHVVSTHGEEALCNIPEYDINIISPRNHEEADTRLILHARDCADKNLTKTVDTDNVVLAIHFFSRLCLQELWITFGVGKNYRYIPIHNI